LPFETTALATLAWMRETGLTQAMSRKSLRWMVESNKNGRFGSTQSTILALRAIVPTTLHTRGRRPPAEFSSFLMASLSVCRWRSQPETQGAITLPEFTQGLGPGKHTLVLRMEEGSSMPYSMSVKYHTTLHPTALSKRRSASRSPCEIGRFREGGITEAGPFR
jgi:hypothetical protein